MTTTRTIELDDPGVGSTPVTVTEHGNGDLGYLLLHGGGGPFTVASFAETLADETGMRVVVPVHPGFDGTPRPEALASVEGLAQVYGALLYALGADDVTVVGNSIGGWIAAELGLLAPSGLSRVVLVDAVGLELPDRPVQDISSLTFDEIIERSYFDPAKFRIDPQSMPPTVLEAMAGNQVALKVYGGSAMVDPTLSARLGAATLPTLVVWGAPTAWSIPTTAAPMPQRFPAPASRCSPRPATCRSWRSRKRCWLPSPATSGQREDAHMRIGVIVGSIRKNRNGRAIGDWVLEHAPVVNGVDFDLLDLQEIGPPLLDAPVPPIAANREYESPAVRRWSDAVAACDGFVFVTPEYNHGVPGAFKNAVDTLAPEWSHKTVAFVSYGADGGIRAVEQWRQIIANLFMIGIRAQVSLSLHHDFDGTAFAPGDRRNDELATLFDQLIALTTRLHG